MLLQGYTKLLHCLGSNIAQFLQNLNNLHLHLSMGWPSMVPPAFRCDEVGGERGGGEGEGEGRLFVLRQPTGLQANA
jgi:hypothetical protein